MKKDKTICIALFFIIVVPIFMAAGQYTQSDGRLSPKLLNYQGYLTDTLGNPINNSSLSLSFAIFDSPSGGSQKWAETQSSVSVDKGIFNVLLGSVTPIQDSVFTASTNRWLELTVAGQVLTPRTRIVSAGYAYTATYSDTALYSRNAAADNDWNFLVSDGADTTLQTGGWWGLARPGNTLYGNADSTHVNFGVACTTGTTGQNYKYCTVGGGRENSASNIYTTTAGGRGNTASGNYATVGGGYRNTANYTNTTVAGGSQNTSSGYYATVGGGGTNTASGTWYATVSGGALNTASGYAATVAGGYQNAAAGNYATVAGGVFDTTQAVAAGVLSGWSNLAGDAVADTGAIVTGGWNNSATDKFAFVGGGMNNTASGYATSVVGGEQNIAGFNYATVGGGYYNYNAGDYSVIAGGYADTITATGDYSFVFGINSNLTQDSTIMIDMPHTWFGDEVTGYEFPRQRGTIGQVMVTDASGQLSWATAAAGADTDWVITDSDMHSGVSGNVGIGISAPRYKLDVNGIICGGTADTVNAVYGGILSGYGNLAGDAAVDTAATVVGGYSNDVTGKFSSIGGGRNNSVAANYSSIVGGYADTIFANAHYSCLFGINSNLTQDSTFMVDMPHTRFGTEATGYEFPRQRGTSGQVMVTNASGQLSWAAASDTDWIISGSNMYSGVSGNVGIGTTSPRYKLDVNGVICGGTNDTVNAFYGGVLSGYSNLAGNDVADTAATVAGGWNNSAYGRYSFVGGGNDNSANSNYATVGGGYSNSASNTYAMVGGGYDNNANGYIATVGGGSSNSASSNYATVGGGFDNNASDYYATVAGGWGNSAGDYCATVAGGTMNTANGNTATVSGGYGNRADSLYSTVGGGSSNSARSNYATVSGGHGDTAAAYCSFATNYSTKVDASDTNSAAFTTSHTVGPNQVRAAAFSTGTLVFTMDHPDDPMNKILNQHAMGSDEAILFYRGTVILDAGGKAVVNLPNYFNKINRNPMIQLTGVGSPDVVYVADKIKDGHFVVGGKPGMEVYWAVTAERTDIHARIAYVKTPVVQEKTGEMRGHSYDDDALIGVYDGLQKDYPGEFTFKTEEGRRVHEQIKEVPAEIERK